LSNAWGFVGGLEINRPLGYINVYVRIILKPVLKNRVRGLIAVEGVRISFSECDN
jgi:hypothetical protein